MSRLNTRTLTPGVMILKISVGPFLVVIITIYQICLIHVPVWTRRGEEIMHFHYLTYMAMSQQKNPCP